MQELEQIENYIVYLIRECGLSVTLHPMEEEALITFSRLMQFNAHDNAYCAHVKSAKNGHEACLLQQKRVFSKMQEVDEAFCGVCHAGVYEYVYPLRSGKSMIGFISVGGYTAERGKERLCQISKTLSCSHDSLAKAYETLKTQQEDRTRIDTLIYPLCQMLELAYTKEEAADGKEPLTRQILRFVQKNYGTDLKVENICRIFGCSRSYISHTFKKDTGKGFRQYLTDVRLENAKRLLALSSLNVTEIAFSVGLLDSNYFSNLFKKKHGVSPLAYRKSINAKE